MRKLLIVVDVQDGFITDASKWLPAKLASYIKTSNYNEVIATQFINNRESSCFRYLRWKGCILPSETAICSKLYGLYSRVFKKDTYTGVTSDLLHFLQAYNFEEIHICGISEGCCVLATAYDLFDLGFNIKVIPALSAVTATREGYQEAVNFLLSENLPCLDIERVSYEQR